MTGSHTRHNIGGALINNNSAPVPIPAVFCAPTVAPAQTPALTEAPALTQAPALTLVSALASVLGLLSRYTDEDLQRATKLVLESFFKGQKHGQLQTSSEA